MRDLLATYGKNIPLNNKNVNAIREFGAANPNVLEHRAMRMRGSTLDDNSDLLSTYLDKVAEETAAPAGRVEVGQPQLAPTQAPAAAPRARTATPGPQLGPNLPMNRGPNDEISGNPQAPSDGGDSWWKLLLAALGTTAAAGAGVGGGALVPGQERRMQGYQPNSDAESVGRAGSRRGGVTDIIDQNDKSLAAPDKKLTGPPNAQLENKSRRLENRTPDQNYESTGSEMDTINNKNAASRKANDAMVQRDVDAENAMLQEQLMKQNKQRQTEELLRRAGRAVGRR